MHTYTRRTRIDAPLEDVWAFHSRIEGLTAVTPNWMGLRVERVVGPDGAADPPELLTGCRIRMSVRPFGIGPRQRWVARIVERTREEGRAQFVDIMEEGPFARWQHTHQFFADGGETVLVDRVEYALPVADVLGPLAIVGFEPMFRYRHRALKQHVFSETIEASSQGESDAD